MEIILLERVEKLGQIGDVVTVSHPHGEAKAMVTAVPFVDKST